jgi:sulfoxide reductase catalytic subunit YedY
LVPPAVSRWQFDPGEDLTSEEAVTTYNNFYEFGTGKGDPGRQIR